jgi:hypothetical protein
MSLRNENFITVTFHQEAGGWRLDTWGKKISRKVAKAQRKSIKTLRPGGFA